MGNVGFDSLLFLWALGLLAAGTLLPLLLIRSQRAATAIAQIIGICGSGLGALCAANVLLAREKLVIHLWSVVPGMPLILTVDVLSAFFLLLISAVGLAASVYSLGYNQGYFGRKNPVWLSALVNLFILSMMTVVTASSGFSFLIAWELMSIVSFLLVMFEYEKKEVRAAGYLYAAMTHIGTVMLTISFLTLFYYTGSVSFAAWQTEASLLPESVKTSIFVMCLIGFGTKAGLIPLHIWLPRAHPAAPSNVSALMSAVMLKTAAYGMLRVAFDFLGSGPAWWGMLLIAVGIISALVGILFALSENDMKRFLAFSSAENMGVIFAAMGAALLFQAEGYTVLAAAALMAMLLHSMSHALFKGLLFFGAGSVLHAAHTKDINELGGLIRRMPRTALMFLIGGMSMSALPPLAGFVSEWAVLQSLLRVGFDSPVVWMKVAGCLAAAILAMVGGMAAMAVVKHFGVAFLAQPRSEKAANAHECSHWMVLGMALLAIPTILMGICPQGALSLISAVTQRYFFLPVEADMLFYVPFVGAETVSAGVAAGTFVLILLAILAGLYVTVGKSRVRIAPTWNCGTTLTARMAFNGTAASHSMLRVFRYITHVKSPVSVDAHYAAFPQRMRVVVSSDLGAEDKLYNPVVKLILSVSHRVKRIQNGNLQSYLAYMVGALVLALLGLS